MPYGSIYWELTTWRDPTSGLTVLGWLDMSDENHVECFTFTDARDAKIARDVLRATGAQKPDDPSRLAAQDDPRGEADR